VHPTKPHINKSWLICRSTCIWLPGIQAYSPQASAGCMWPASNRTVAWSKSQSGSSHLPWICPLLQWLSACPNFLLLPPQGYSVKETRHHLRMFVLWWGGFFPKKGVHILSKMCRLLPYRFLQFAGTHSHMNNANLSFAYSSFPETGSSAPVFCKSWGCLMCSQKLV
jgi:hypothetical protein